MNVKDDFARKLADAHRSLEPSIERILRIVAPGEDRSNEPIKLLEVNHDTSPSGIVPIAFGPSADLPFPTVVVEVTPDEFELLAREELYLPSGWELGETLYQMTGEGSDGVP
jgi:hypothetical protein